VTLTELRSIPATGVPERFSELGSAERDNARPRRFSVSVLARRTGVPVPTIHYYRRIGLLPQPTTASVNRFLYGEDHVVALSAVRFLRERHHLRLEDVRRVLPEVLAAAREGVGPEGWDRIVDARARSENLPTDRLLAAAREAFARHGYDGVCVGDLCDAAGIAKGSFYRYFASKDELFVAAARSMVDAVDEGLPARPGILTEHEAVGALRRILEPLAPLLLEAATRELRKEPKLAGVVASVSQGLAARLLPRLRGGRAGAVPTARRVVETVLLGFLRPAFGLRSPA